MHDLLNPVAAVHGNLTFLETVLVGDVREAARDALEEIRRLERLLREVQQFARLAALGEKIELQRSQTSLAAAAGRAVEDLLGESRLRGVEVEVTGDAQALVDANLLICALRNLVAIALRYSKRGDRVTVTIEEASGGARISVIDRGSALPEAERHALLAGEDVGEASRARPAAVLLFSLAQAEARAQGAELTIESRDGETAGILQIR